MHKRSTPYIAAAARLTDAVFIAFGDGKSAFFSANLLYANLPYAVEVVDSEEETHLAQHSHS